LTVASFTLLRGQASSHQAEVVVGKFMGSRRLSQRGVSLLDTLCVVTIAGSVSAVALPKVSHLPQQARSAAVHAMAGAVTSASQLMHMKCAVQAACSLHAGDAVLVLPDGDIGLTRGYPRGGSDDGIVASVSQTGFSVAHGDGLTVFAKEGAPQPQACAVSYAEPPRDGAAPVVRVFTEGC
jgi:type II secretory pathway pseudopilin PulG